MDDAQPTPVSRRRMLKRIGAGAAVAWSAPILTSMRVPAFAQYGGNCEPAKQFCGPPDPRCGVPGVACPLPNGCAVGACTLQLDNSCLCWDFAVCTSPNPICQSDADCGPGFKCGPVDPSCMNLCAGNRGCFHQCGVGGSAPRSRPGLHVIRA